jgi:hypothetical protein
VREKHGGRLQSKIMRAFLFHFVMGTSLCLLSSFVVLGGTTVTSVGFYKMKPATHGFHQDG